MEFAEAVVRSIQAYWEGVEPETLYKQMKSSSNKPKYTKKFFDNFESQKFNNEVAKKVEKGV